MYNTFQQISRFAQYTPEALSCKGYRNTCTTQASGCPLPASYTYIYSITSNRELPAAVPTRALSVTRVVCNEPRVVCNEPRVVCNEPRVVCNGQPVF